LDKWRFVEAFDGVKIAKSAKKAFYTEGSLFGNGLFDFIKIGVPERVFIFDLFRILKRLDEQNFQENTVHPTFFYAQKRAYTEGAPF
jgi:hypothetical protein